MDEITSCFWGQGPTPRPIKFARANLLRVYHPLVPAASRGVAAFERGVGCQQSTGLLTPRINYPSSSLQKALTTPRVKNLAVCSINRSKSTLEVSLAPSEITRTMTKGTPNS